VLSITPNAPFFSGFAEIGKAGDIAKFLGEAAQELVGSIQAGCFSNLTQNLFEVLIGWGSNLVTATHEDA
jgi:hypothetical protein